MEQNQSSLTRITPSLLSSWLWSFKREGGYEDFLSTLKREPFEPNEAMQNGILFEDMIRKASEGTPPLENHAWYKGVMQASAILRGSAEQVRGERIINVSGRDFLLVGVADNIKAGIVYDTKLSMRYEYGNYVDSPQHSAYFRLWPEALLFVYLVFDGDELSTESYFPFDVPPIERYIADFIKYLKQHNLMQIYEQNWGAY